MLFLNALSTYSYSYSLSLIDSPGLQCMQMISLFFRNPHVQVAPWTDLTNKVQNQLDMDMEMDR